MTKKFNNKVMTHQLLKMILFYHVLDYYMVN